MMDIDKIALEVARKCQIDVSAVMAPRVVEFTHKFLAKVQEQSASEFINQCASGEIAHTKEVTRYESIEPVGHVYRHGRDSHGREWHGIHWYDPNLDVPTGTKIYTTPPKPDTEVEKDAARWRWLSKKAFTEDRDGGYVKYYVFPFVCYANGADYKGHKPYYYKTLDAAIDAAMERGE